MSDILLADNAQRRSAFRQVILIDRRRARALLREVVAELGPQFIFTGPYTAGGECRYVDAAGDGVCIVGRALIRAGVDPAALACLEGRRAARLADALYPDVLITSSAAAILDAAQNAQDVHGTWGDALTAAEQVYAGSLKPAPAKLTTPVGAAAALDALAAAEEMYHLPRPLEARLLPDLGEVDVHLACPDDLSAWADALNITVVHDGPIDRARTMLSDGHPAKLWTRVAMDLTTAPADQDQAATR